MEYKGKNTSRSLKFLFQERAKWFNHFRNEDGSFVENSYIEMNIFERVFFQRINGRFESIIPDPNQIKYATLAGGKQVQGLNFAVDAFKKFASDLNNINSSGDSFKEQNHPYLLTPIVYQSYIPPENEYKYYYNKLMQDFTSYIKTNKLHSSIAQFGDFVNLFVSFLKQKGSKFPITFTGWQKSSNSNIFTSGLAFSIAPLNCGDDTKKEEFVNSGLFQNYVQTANQNGFFIMAGCPWIMVMSTDSAKTIDFSSEYDLNSKSAIKSVSFKSTYLEDISNIKYILRLYYNIYINKYNYYKDIIYNGKKTIQKNIQRQEISKEELNSQYDDLYWLLLYNEIRNIEEDMMFNKAEFEVIKKKATFFHKKLDNETALGYINDQYRFSYVYKSGGVNDYLRKRNQQPEE